MKRMTLSSLLFSTPPLSDARLTYHYTSRNSYIEMNSKSEIPEAIVSIYHPSISPSSKRVARQLAFAK